MPVQVERKSAGFAASVGLAAGAALTTVNFTHPIELVKTRLQTGGAPRPPLPRPPCAHDCRRHRGAKCQPVEAISSSRAAMC